MGSMSGMFDGEDKLSLPLYLLHRKYKLVASGCCYEVKSAQEENGAVEKPKS